MKFLTLLVLLTLPLLGDTAYLNEELEARKKVQRELMKDTLETLNGTLNRETLETTVRNNTESYLTLIDHVIASEDALLKVHFLRAEYLLDVDDAAWEVSYDAEDEEKRASALKRATAENKLEKLKEVESKLTKTDDEE